MTNKDSDPAAATDNLSLAREAFQHCNDQHWLHTVTRLLENWNIKRTCWLCHREMQGYEVHFSLCSARVTPYTRRVLEELNEDSSTVNLEHMQIVVCTPCGSMVTFKAAEEAAKVRRELTAKLEHALDLIQALENRVSQLEQRLSVHESHVNRF